MRQKLLLMSVTILFSAGCIGPTCGGDDSAGPIFIDAGSDWIDSISFNTPTYTGNEIDIAQVRVALARSIDQDAVDDYNASCANMVSLCYTPFTPAQLGDDILSFEMQLVSSFIATTDTDYIYSLVVDRDGRTENNWVPQGGFDWDFFQGTDWWSQAIYDYDVDTWSMSVQEVDDQQNITAATASSVQLEIAADLLTWKVRMPEFSDYSGARLTTFGHDGAFSASYRGGDVDGPNPTGQLRFQRGF